MLAVLPGSVFAQIQNAPVTALTIEKFDLGDTDRKAFGAFDYVGGLVLRSSNPHFGALSGLRIADDGALTAVTDTGFWFRGKISRDDKGRPNGIDGGQIAPVFDVDGEPFKKKWRSDLEGLTIAGDAAYVATEMEIRVLRFERSPGLLTATPVRITGTLPGRRLLEGFALEAIATMPVDHPRAGWLLALGETDPQGGSEIPAFLIGPKRIETLSVKQSSGYYITDADFLPGGDLLILERRYSLSTGPAMRLRRIDGDTIAPGATLGGEVVMEANERQVIDNMEGLSVFLGPDDEVRIGLVSDNNHWPLQRTLYLEFRLRQ